MLSYLISNRIIDLWMGMQWDLWMLEDVLEEFKSCYEYHVFGLSSDFSEFIFINLRFCRFYVRINLRFCYLKFQNYLNSLQVCTKLMQLSTKTTPAIFFYLILTFLVH